MIVNIEIVNEINNRFDYEIKSIIFYKFLRSVVKINPDN